MNTATFEGFINVDKNAVFTIQGKYSKGIFELKDGIDADQFVIGEEYDITGIVKSKRA